MINQVFGRLTVVEQRGVDRKRSRLWFCTCTCGGNAIVDTSTLRSGKTKSCGCLAREYKMRLSEESATQSQDLFWSRVDMSGGPHACWPWLGSTDDNGYGTIHFASSSATRAHIFALNSAEPLPFVGAQTLHHCDNPPCCNPLHLYWGTHDNNASDRESRGRSGKTKRRGSANCNFIDLTGRRFGRLTVVAFEGSELAGGRSRGTTWRCRCDCGTECVKRSVNLSSGDTRSCGCLSRQRVDAAPTDTR